MTKRYDLAVIGLGYIGLPAAALAAEAGMNVLGVDINKSVVEAVNRGRPHINEPGVEEKLRKAGSRLKAATTLEESEIYMIAVPTPVNAGRQPDMRAVESAAAAIARVITPGALVILQSTSPVGATRKHVRRIIELRRPDMKDKACYAYCPERAIPGKSLKEILENDRPVGGLNAKAAGRAIAFYKRLGVTGRLLETTAETAEMVKLVENASRDVQIAFANEVANLCDHHDLNPWKVINLANCHPRVNILNPGPGVGGHCLAVDPWFLIHAAPEKAPLMRAARAVNDSRPAAVVHKIAAAAKAHSNPVICLLGLSYKENIDDFRESPSVSVAESLMKGDFGNILVVEPYLETSDRYKLVTLEEGVARAQVVVLLTAHSCFAGIEKKLQGKTFINTRGALAA